MLARALLVDRRWLTLVGASKRSFPLDELRLDLRALGLELQQLLSRLFCADLLLLPLSLNFRKAQAYYNDVEGTSLSGNDPKLQEQITQVALLL